MSNFLSDYAEFTSGNEASRYYHLWSAFVALSSIISRRVWIDLGYFNVYPNLYVVLVGPAGNKKTTAMNIAKALVREVGDIPFSAECQTKESLVKDWKENERVFVDGETNMIYTPISIFSTEMSEFVGPNAGHMINFLVTVFDLPIYDLRTKNKGEQYIIGPYVVFVGCTTPDWITIYLKTDIISGGFSRRTIFVNEPDEDVRITFPSITPEMKAAWERLVARGKELQQMGGLFRWDAPAKIFFHKWYMTREIPDDPLVRGYHKTKHIQLLKVGMLIALAETGELLMRQEHLEIAMEALGHTEQNLAAVFHGFGRNELFAISSKIIEFLERADRLVKEEKLYSIFFREADSREMYNIMSHLEKSGAIMRVEETIGGKKHVLVGLPAVVARELEKQKEKGQE